MRKQKFSNLKLSDVMPMLAQDRFTEWKISAPPRLPSPHLEKDLQRLRRFDTLGTEAAKLLLVDTLLAEIVPDHAKLKVWKGAVLESATLTEFADYLVTPDYAYVKTPLLCGVESENDDFERGRVQCLAGLVVCREQNLAVNYDCDLYGFVIYWKTWFFYRLTTNELHESRG